MKHRITRPVFGDEELAAVGEVLDSGWVTQGPQVAAFERLVAARHGVDHALATTSATAALHLAAVALGFQPGDEVVVPALTWITSANCVEYAGASVVFADVDPRTWNLDPAALERAITPRTRGIVVVHLFGQAADMDAILAIARRHDLRVIEDAACGVGTTWRGRPIGGLGDVGCLSFHPRKVISTGEGGMLLTNDAVLAARLDALRNHGAGPPDVTGDIPRPHHMPSFDVLGFNYRMADILGAIGVAQMARLDDLLRERVRLAARYSALLAALPGVRVPEAIDGAGHTYQSYVIALPGHDVAARNAIMESLATAGVQTRPGTHAVHRLGYYVRRYGHLAEAFPHACAGQDSTITLPLYPGMQEADQREIVDALRDALAGR